MVPQVTYELTGAQRTFDLASSIAECVAHQPDGATLGASSWYQHILQELPVAVYITNARGRIIFFNKAAIEMAGRTPKLGVDKWCVAWKLYRPDGTRLPHNEYAMAMALKQNRVIRGAEAIAERPDGTRVPFVPFSTPLRNAAGELIGSLSLLLDITYIKQAEQQLAYLADHDVLTGLPSRVVFSTRLSHVIEAAKAAGTNFAVVCLDLDRFKEINDAFGHAVGDEALKIVATRLKRAAPKFFIARIGGDAMIMIVPEAENEAALMRQLVAFQLAVGKEMHIADHVLRINFSAGVAQFPSRGADEIEIVANANAALRQAKRDGSGSLRVFDAKMERRMRDRACIQRDLRSTILENRNVQPPRPSDRAGRIHGARRGGDGGRADRRLQAVSRSARSLPAHRRTGGAGENSGGWRDRDEGRCDGGALTNVR